MRDGGSMKGLFEVFVFLTRLSAMGVGSNVWLKKRSLSDSQDLVAHTRS